MLFSRARSLLHTVEQNLCKHNQTLVSAQAHVASSLNKKNAYTYCYITYNCNYVCVCCALCLAVPVYTRYTRTHTTSTSKREWDRVLYYCSRIAFFFLLGLCLTFLFGSDTMCYDLGSLLYIDIYTHRRTHISWGDICTTLCGLASFRLSHRRGRRVRAVGFCAGGARTHENTIGQAQSQYYTYYLYAIHTHTNTYTQSHMRSLEYTFVQLNNLKFPLFYSNS